MAEENPPSPGSLAQILSNLFRREDGEPMDFYIRKFRFRNRSDKQELKEKFLQLSEEVDRCGGKLLKDPVSNHAVELSFRELFDDDPEVDSDIFDAEYIYECVKHLEVLELEPFRIGKSPYDGAIDITEILKGNNSWDSINRSIPTPQKGKKLPDFGIQLSPQFGKQSPPKKKKRCEYTVQEDMAILRFVLDKNLYDKVGGNTTWRLVARELPHSYQSLQNRFRRAILPNIHKYTGLTESERNLFRRDNIELQSFSRPQLQESISSDDGQSDATGIEADMTDSFQSATTVLMTESKNNLSELEDDAPNHSQTSPTTTNMKDPLNQSAVNETSNDSEHDKHEESSVVSPMHVINSEDSDPSPSTSTPVRVRRPKILSSPEEIADELNIITCEPEFNLPLTDHSSNDEDTSSSPVTQPKPKVLKSKKMNRLYSLKEDRLIISFISNNERYDHIYGKKLWTDIQDTVLSKFKRSWESVKTRFLKTIIRDIDSLDYDLDEDVIERFRAKCKPTKPTNETNRPASSKCPDSAHGSNKASPYFSNESPTSKTSSRGQPKTSGQSRQYTFLEDNLIINYIVETKRFSEVRGRSLWVDIQNIVLNDYQRTWESAKNRFRKTIMKDLTKYELEDEIIQKFRDGAIAERNMGGAKKNAKTHPRRSVKHPALKRSQTPSVMDSMAVQKSVIYDSHNF